MVSKQLTIIITSILGSLYNLITGIAATVVAFTGTNIILPGYPINIQAWLAIVGIYRITSAFAIINVFIVMCKTDGENDNKKNLISQALFATVWLIYGTVLIARGDWLINQVYRTAYGLILLDWIIIAIALFGGCCVGCIAICAKRI